MGLHLTDKVNTIDRWLEEKSGIGPEPLLIPAEDGESPEATIYADDNSAGESGSTVDEVKGKTEVMLNKIFDHMRTGRLLVNPDKTKIMLFATNQKRARNNLKFEITIEDTVIKEVQTARLLGVVLSNNFSWDEQVKITLEECSGRLNGMYKVSRELDTNQRKNLAEGAILSRLRYALETISSGSETNMKKLEAMQSKAARYVLQRSRNGWSRTEGYRSLGWLTLSQTAIEMSLRLFFKILWNKKPVKIYSSIFNEEQGQLFQLSKLQLESLTKLSRKSWRIRVLRYSSLLPEDFYYLDPESMLMKTALKDWIANNIEKDGDHIFRGNFQFHMEEDWLCREIETWKKREEHDLESQKEAEILLEET